jgi:phospholipid transport system substrate-binding protein
MNDRRQRKQQDNRYPSTQATCEGTPMINRRTLGQMASRICLTLGLALSVLSAATIARAAEETPDAFITRVSTNVLETIKADKTLTGDVDKIVELVDSRVMPYVNFVRMTASAVGPAWRQATPEQKKQLQDEFKTLLVRTYSGALAQVSDQTITVKPIRMAPEDKDVVVRTEIRGRNDPIQLDYRLEKAADGSWKIYNLNVLGVWLVETYRSQFAQEINANGLDGLVAALTKRNKSNSARKG